ncbi:hypothetical protein ABIA35_006603 [Catenulispora sp. MAP12-49]|uniref:hypothetical protein n=1 Tax=Catenulispora sp. MAP12-49 TaxID=3156302 RepID=UPI003512A4CD
MSDPRPVSGAVTSAAAPSSGIDPVLLVPIRVEALLVNDAVRAKEMFQRWQANYALSRVNLSPEPPPFTNVDLLFRQHPASNGVHLHWQLPDAVKHGHHEQGAAGPDFPKVPNRWFVVRYAGPPGAAARTRRKAWVVESDTLARDGAIPYLHPVDGTLTRMGRRADLDNPWTEPRPGPGQFLTAVGPGLDGFADYQPYNTDVFSIHDDLRDLDTGQEHTVSYLVAGWYSDPAADPLAPLVGLVGEELDLARAELTAELQWSVPGGPALARTVCHGTVLGLQWQPNLSPRSERPDTIRLAVGHTIADATAALDAAVAAETGQDDAELLELMAACNAGLLDTLDEPDGEFQKRRATHASWFTPTPAGHVWTWEHPEDEAADRRLGRDAAARAGERVLAALNSAQAAHDQALGQLIAAQRRVYDLWWANQLPRIPDQLGADNLQAALDDALDRAGGFRDEVLALRADIPWAQDDQDLEREIARYQVEHGMDGQLKRGVLPDFYLPNDPTVVIAGAKFQRTWTSDADAGQPPLPCRAATDTVTGLRWDGGILTGSPTLYTPAHLPAPAGLAGVLPALLAEAFHLDPANAPALAQATGHPAADLEAAIRRGEHAGTGPHFGTEPWTQPWSPLYFQWEAEFFPIPWHDAAGTAMWAFNGESYDCLDAGRPPSVILRGRQGLTSAPADTMAARLRDHAANHPGPHAPVLRALAERAAAADRIGQPLSGFTEQIHARHHHQAVIPHTVPDALRGHLEPAWLRGQPPNPGTLPRPFTGYGPTRFHELCTGQFAIRRLMIVDRFGRALPAVHIPARPTAAAEGEDPDAPGSDYLTFEPVRPAHLRPTYDQQSRPITVEPSNTQRFIQLTPRLAQPARTCLTFLDTADDTPLDQAPRHTATPVCGWLLPHYLDRALLCYAPDGTPLGRLRSTVLSDGSPRLTWHQLPHAPDSGYDHQLALADHPHLLGFVSALIAPGDDPDRGPAALDALLAVIDRTLTTITPTSEPAASGPGSLLGRPLALIRAHVSLALDGPPHTDPHWPNLLQPVDPAYPAYRFPIRLGQRDQLSDGLIGYFRDQDYTTMYTVLDADELPDDPIGTPGSSLAPIGAGAVLTLPAQPVGTEPTATDTAYLSLLADPHATVHATTDILPTATLKLPAHITAPAMANLAVTFHLNPILTTDAPVEDDRVRSGEPAIQLPLPSDRHGAWTWARPETRFLEGGFWNATDLDVEPADDQPLRPQPAPALRAGALQLRPHPDETR